MKFLENVATVEGNAIFEETVKMSVQNESITHIIKSLTDMYSNPLLALSREYISNAYDAVVARMGVESSFGTVLDTPIEVTLPSSLNPSFIVRDYGTGMDREILSIVFPQYGASTKRDNNNEIGGFGLGAKSALAVVANFTVVSVKDGKKNTGIVQKGADGVGEISFLPEIETDEPSGTTVTITLPSAGELNSIFRNSNLLLGFPHGSILLNGKMHDNSVYNPERYTRVSEDAWIENSLLNWNNNQHQHNLGYGHRNGRWGYMVVVVGPISYTVNTSDLIGEGSFDRESVLEIFDAASAASVLNLPIGSVDFTPARENLIFSERTRKTIMEASKRRSKAVNEYVQAQLAESPNKAEAVRRAELLRRAGFELDWTYKGEVIPEMHQSAFYVEGKETWVSNHNYKVTPKSFSMEHSNTHTSNTVVVAGVKDAEMAKVLNRFRKPFIDRYEKANFHPHYCSVLYTQAEKSELGDWAEVLPVELYTPEEWEAKGLAYRKEINEERKAKRAASGIVGTPNLGSTPVSVIQLSSDTHTRPKSYSDYASDVAKSDNVIYIRMDNDKPGSLAHKCAKTMSGVNPDFSVQSMNHAFTAVKRHYSKDDKTVRLVRIPAGTKVETFLKAVPHAVSIDEAFKAVVKSIIADTDDKLSLLIARRSYPFHWLTAMSDTVTDGVENEEVREFLVGAHRSFLKADEYKTRSAVRVMSDLIFSAEFEAEFAELRKAVENSNKFPLPLLGDIGARHIDSKNALQYINLMYPASA